VVTEKQKKENLATMLKNNIALAFAGSKNSHWYARSNL